MSVRLNNNNNNNSQLPDGFVVSNGGGYNKNVFNDSNNNNTIVLTGLSWAILLFVLTLTIFNTICCLMFLNIKFGISRYGENELLIIKDDMVIKNNLFLNSSENKTEIFQIYNSSISLDKICNNPLLLEHIYINEENNTTIPHIFYNTTLLNDTFPGAIIKLYNDDDNDDIYINPLILIKELWNSVIELKNNNN